MRYLFVFCKHLVMPLKCRKRKVWLNHWRRSGIFIVNFEHISQLVLVFLFLILNIDPGKNKWGKVKKLSKTRKDQKTLISVSP